MGGKDASAYSYDRQGQLNFSDEELTAITNSIDLYILCKTNHKAIRVCPNISSGLQKIAGLRGGRDYLNHFFQHQTQIIQQLMNQFPADYEKKVRFLSTNQDKIVARLNQIVEF